ncbi:hypothetical protein QOT17_010162 [Balamuthia mandrillaris]
MSSYPPPLMEHLRHLSSPSHHASPSAAPTTVFASGSARLKRKAAPIFIEEELDSRSLQGLKLLKLPRKEGVGASLSSSLSSSSKQSLHSSWLRNEKHAGRDEENEDVMVLVPATPEPPLRTANLMQKRRDAEGHNTHYDYLMVFKQLCEKHSKFLHDSLIVDRYLIAVVYILLRRARLSLTGFLKDRYLFYGLFLALETEEDLAGNVDELIDYCIGKFPVMEDEHEDDKGHQEEKRRKQLATWKANLTRFQVGKNRLWKRLGLRTWVSRELCERCLLEVDKWFGSSFTIFQKTRYSMDLCQLYEMESKLRDENDEENEEEEEEEDSGFSSYSFSDLEEDESESIADPGNNNTN